MAKKAEKNLVIVESPAKAKTIGKYLGPSYQVKACMGHLRDLPKSKLGVDVDNDFEPDYRPIKGKEDIIRDLRAAADERAAVYLATDPDREGEAISWHLKYLLELPDERAHRVTFNEITRKVVTESIAAPREIDQNLVDAQQARRILDRIVGYQLSPQGPVRGPCAVGRDASGRRPRERNPRLRAAGILDARRHAAKRRGRQVLRALLRAGRQEVRAAVAGRYRADPTGAAGSAVRGQEREAHGQKAQPLTPVFNLHAAAGGLTQAQHDAPAHDGHRPAAL